MAFEQACEGRTYRQIAQALNAEGYRTAGNMGNGPFSKDSVAGILRNRFYIGELPDGNGGYIKGKHEPLISVALFNAVQERLGKRQQTRDGSVRRRASTYSLTGLARCAICEATISISRTKDGRARTCCRGRAKGAVCDFRGTFLDAYEAQIEWYLQNFIIPEDYQQRILEAHRKLTASSGETDGKREELQGRRERIKKLFQWADIDEQKYLLEKRQIDRELRQLAPPSNDLAVLNKLAAFLTNVAQAWKEASQEQRNKLAKALFEEVWIKHNRVVEVKPREELKPFFQLSYEQHLESGTCGPESHRGRH